VTDEELLVQHLAWRGVEDPCQVCGGSGRREYSNTSTWRGGAGGRAFTADVCDTCWGTGDRFRTGVDLRRLRNEQAAAAAAAAVELLARSVGAQSASCRPAIAKIIETLDELAAKRDRRGALPAAFLPELARGLANTLRRAIGAPERPR